MGLRKICLLIFCAFSFCFANEESELLKKIELQILLKDYGSAREFCRIALKKFPKSKNLEKAFLKTLMPIIEEREFLPFLLEYEKNYGKDRNILEEFSWSVLEKGLASPQYNVRLHALTGSLFTHDAKSVLFLVASLDDSNAIIRATAAQLSKNCQDEILKRKIQEKFKKEGIWWVRLELIRNFGAMNIFKGKEEILKILDSPHTTLEERAAAWESLFLLSQEIDTQRLLELFESNRKELRGLACQIAFLKDCFAVKEKLFEKLKDPSFEVKIAALNALTWDFFSKDSKKYFDSIFSCLEDENPLVGIAASRLCFAKDPKFCEKHMRNWILKDPFSHVARQAANVLLKIGPPAIPLINSLLDESKDPFIRVNLALGLLAFQDHEKKACDVIFSFLQEKKEKLMIVPQNQSQQSFIIAPSTLSHVDSIPHFPESMDLYVRLHLAALLAAHKDSRAIEVVKTHLKKTFQGTFLTRLSTLLLLQEGEEEAFDFVKELLQDPDPNLRIEAALVMAFFAKDPDALPVLKKSYQKASYMQKLEIIEAIGSIGDEKSIDFFLECMEEPFQILRVGAAAGLIQSLYQ